MQEYIKIPAIQTKLKQSEDRIVYIYGATGFGKTAAVNYFLRRTKHLMIQGHRGVCNEFPEVSEIKEKIIVVDDIQWITDEKSRHYVRELCTCNKFKVILIGRGRLPGWLVQVDLMKKIFQCGEKDLLFGEKEIELLFEQNGILLEGKQRKEIQNISRGYAVVILLFLRHMECGEKLDENLLAIIEKELFGYIDTACWERLNTRVKNLLIPLCEYPIFTVELAKTVVKKEEQVEKLLEYAENIGLFLERKNDSTWEIRDIMVCFLKWKYSVYFSEEEQKNHYTAAASYYEKRKEIDFALEYYKRAGNQSKVSQILVKNAKKHPGTANFFEARQFYFSLPKEEIKKNPILMDGMSMLYSIMLQPEESEYWYKQLEIFSKKDTISKMEKKEAKARLAYLNIALPHRGIKGIIDLLKTTALMVEKKEVKLPEFSVTGNIPSLMNGGKDFCEWSRYDKKIALILRKPVEMILGKYGKGFVDIALAESGFEKSTMSDYEVQARLNTGCMMADAGGKIEVSFAGTGVLVRLYLARGQMELAKKTIKSFQKKVEMRGARQLLPNIGALKVEMSLLLGNREEIEKWLLEAPDETADFCILDRYRYMQKIRCFIALAKYDEAIGLIERMNLYFTQYERNYYWMENQILKAIILYRIGDANWGKILKAALKKCEYYHFVRIASREGAALKPLLDDAGFLEFLESSDISQGFIEEVRTDTMKIAHFYPEYLHSDVHELVNFTAKEIEILKLICHGFTSQEICERCNITYNSLKFHNKNIYKKLGVKSRKETERKAYLLGF